MSKIKYSGLNQYGKALTGSAVKGLNRSMDKNFTSMYLNNQVIVIHNYWEKIGDG